jgi:hypothetical protein
MTVTDIFAEVRRLLPPESFLGGTEPMKYAHALRRGERPEPQPGSPAAEGWPRERWTRYLRLEQTYSANRMAIWRATGFVT